MDKRFYATNTSMLNIYAKCLYQKVSETEGEKIMLPNGRKTVTMSDGVICEDMYGIGNYFNQATVQVDYHVPFRKFEACSDEVGRNYAMFPNASYWLYPILMKEKLRIWILSGDVDNSVPVTGTVNWLTKLRD
jgi:hypothetical protein